MKKAQTDLLQGTLDLLVLKTLQSGPTHGWDIAQRIQTIHRGGGTDSENVLNGRISSCSTS
jgi:DNA-binding PadR family transcriptional regulator